MTQNATTDRAPDRVTRLHIAGMSPTEIAEVFDLKGYQGRQVFRWVFRSQAFDFDAMTNLSKSLRATLAERGEITRLKHVHTSVSSNTHTRKALFQLPDGESVESVMIPAADRVTLCLSTQVGCPIRCSFCATGLSGYARNLSAGEIVEQTLVLLRDVDLEGRTPNIVFMGMGEPFRNYDATVKAVRLLMEPEGLGIGARRITVSTAGDVPGIRRFAAENWQVRLSVSLHAANDVLRDELVPLNRRYPIQALMDAIDEYLAGTGRQITFEWTLLDGVNDRLQDADELAQLVSGRRIFVNLIPYNPVAGIPYRAPSRERAEAFQNALAARGVRATLRLERGQDINAACGQLRRHALASQD